MLQCYEVFDQFFMIYGPYGPTYLYGYMLKAQMGIVTLKSNGQSDKLKKNCFKRQR